jgi:SH3 domain
MRRDRNLFDGLANRSVNTHFPVHTGLGGGEKAPRQLLRSEHQERFDSGAQEVSQMFMSIVLEVNCLHSSTRYGFVLERCVQSMAKHWCQYFEVGHSTIESNIDWWNETAASRETLPPPDAAIPKKLSMPREMSSGGYDAYGSVKSAMRKPQSIAASTGSLADATSNYQMSRPRAMSEHSLTSSPQQNSNGSTSAASVVTALYGYMSSGENQLSFAEGDKILLIGEKTQGWQFGENMSSNVFGWFPISYVQHEPER